MSALSQLAESLGLSSDPKPMPAAPAAPGRIAVTDLRAPEQIGWLAAVASCLEVSTGFLLERGFIDQHDMMEQIAADPHQVAALIKTNPMWH